MSEALLTVESVRISADDTRQRRAAGRLISEPIDFSVERGEAVALVGPSGSGKTSLALALMGLTPDGVSVVGSIGFDGIDLLRLKRRGWAAVRGSRIAMVTQDPIGWLDPVQHVDDQVAEVVRSVHGSSRRHSRTQARELLLDAGFPDDPRLLHSFPHQLSGGLCQRVAIAMAVAGKPQLLIADEPTSALDATVQREVLDTLLRLRHDHQMALLLITHDSTIVDYVGARRVDVTGAPATRTVRQRPQLPDVGDRVVLEGRRLHKRFGHTDAVVGVDIRLHASETLGLLGDSGSCKTTLLRLLLGLLTPSSGDVLIDGVSLASTNRSDRRRIRSRVQFVAQNQYGALDPRMSVGRLLEEPLRVHGMCTRETPQQINRMLETVGLSLSRKSSKPHELSGGERQRVAIARALMLNPEVLALDEPLTGLDESLQEEIVELLAGLRTTRGLSLLIVAHDLGMVRRLSHRVMVMSKGTVVEEAPADQLGAHPHTQRLLSATLTPPVGA